MKIANRKRPSGMEYWVPPAAPRTVARSGSNFKQHQKPETPYAAATFRKLLNRYLQILEELQKDLENNMAPMDVTVMGSLLELAPAAMRISCNHLVNYLEKYKLDPKRIMIRKEIRGIGLTWAGGKDIASGIALIKQHIKKAK